jgi:hypothetical protein
MNRSKVILSSPDFRQAKDSLLSRRCLVQISSAPYISFSKATKGSVQEPWRSALQISELTSRKIGKKIDTMNRRTKLTLSALAFLWLGVVLPADKAAGQQAARTLKDQIVGTWIYAAGYTAREDGTTVDTFGPNPRGILMFDADGHMSLQQMRSDLPKFASNNRQEGTAGENKAIVQGSICYFGTYTVDEAEKTLIFHIESCTFPNWTGTDLKRPITLTGDELAWNAIGSSTRPIRSVWKRAK